MAKARTVIKPSPMNKRKVRMEDEIRADLYQQLKDMFKRFEDWKCRS